MTLLSADAGGINVAETLNAELAGPATYYVWITGYGITEGPYDLSLSLTALTEYDCADGDDEDGDDLVDCCDDDCALKPVCAAEDWCVDGEDNDCDGLADCDDEDCMGTAGCGAGDSCEDVLLINDGVALDASYDGVTLEYWGTTIGYTNDFTGSCDEDTATTADAVWELTVAETVAVNVGMDYQSYFYPAVYITDAPCGEGEELVCATAGSDFAWTGDTVLEPGTYYVILDASWPGDEEVYQLLIDVTAIYETEVDCGDGIDNDFDGLLDCCDDDCVGAEGCLEVCGDGLDNDCDEAVDCCDDDCAADEACAIEADCADGVDNDCDGLWDCGDADCGLVPECEGEGCAAAVALNEGNPIKQADDGLQLVVAGDTSEAQNDHAGSCDDSTADAKDLVYTFEIAEAIGVSISHEFDGYNWPAVYLYGGDCFAESELACAFTSSSDPAVIPLMLVEPGTYYVVVDSSYSSDAGPFMLILDFVLDTDTETDCHDGVDNDLNELTDCADPVCAADEGCAGEVCETAFELYGGVAITTADDGLQIVAQGDTTEASPDLAGSCDPDTAAANDLVYTFTLDEPMGVKVHYDFDNSYYFPAVFVFADACMAENELGCAATSGDPAVIDYMVYEAGTYFIVADSSYPSDASAFTLTVDFMVAEDSETDCGDGVDNDFNGLIDCDEDICAEDAACMGETCDTAIPLDEGLGWGADDDGLVVSVEGDTTLKSDDYDFECDGDGTAGKDLAYTFTLTEPMGVELTYDFTDSGEWEQFFLATACDVDGVLACAHTTGEPATILAGEIEAGTYYVIVDGDDSIDEGPFTLTVTLTKIATTETDCTDGIDNELDGFTDCCDDECAADAACLAETVCDDDFDNDCDGVSDCGDADCAADLSCEGESCAAPIALNGGAAVIEDDLPLQLVETGDTSAAGADVSGSCDAITDVAKDLVYELVLDTAANVTITHDFDSDSLWPAVYVFAGECIADNELACDAQTSDPAVIEALALEAGIYYIVVDASYSSDAGPYTLTIDITGPTTVEDDCNDGVDNDQDGFTDCEDDDCGPEICDPEALPWSEDFSYLPGDDIKGGIYGTDEVCGWELTADPISLNGFAEFGFADGCSALETHYWIVGALLDVQACGEISVTFDEAADFASWAVSHQLAIFDGFTPLQEIELPLDGLTSDWAASGPHLFDVSALGFVRIGAGYLGDDADTWRVDNFVVECTSAQEICDDGEDNDGDQAVDCDDEDCADFIGCLGANCELPLPLTDAPVTLADAGLQVVAIGDTTDASSEYEGSCESNSAGSADLAYSFELSETMYISVSHDFDGTSMWSAAYLYAGTCELASELACNAGDSGASEFGLTLDAGTYFIIVDASWVGDAGPFTLTVDFLAPPLADEIGLCADGEDNDMDGDMDCADDDCAADGACAGASCDNPIILSPEPIDLADDGLEIVVTGDTSLFGNTYGGTCSDDSAEAKDVAYVFELASSMFVAGSHDFDGTSNWSAAYLLAGSCDLGIEVACATGNSGAAELEGLLPAGTYFVIVDANWDTDAGPYTLTMTFAAPPPETEVGLCTDGEDNDLDELTDCLDVDDCAADPGCGDDDDDGVPNYLDVCDLGSDTVDEDDNNVPDACQIEWAGDVWPNSGTEIDTTEAIDVFVQVYFAGVTDAAADAAGMGIEVNLVYQSEFDLDTVVAMAYNQDIGNNDEFMATIPADATVADEAMAISFEVYYLSGEAMHLYDGVIEDQANATPISYTITGQAGDASNPIISEYVEGSSNNKAVEIVNLGSGDLDLAICELNFYFNGSTDVGFSHEATDADTLILETNEVWVVCHPSFDEAVLDTYCNHTTSGVMFFNGDDVVELSCGGETRDIIGKLGQDPDPGYWGTGEAVTKDATLRRKCDITVGDTDGTDDFDPAVEWNGYPQNTYDSLGVNSCI